MEHLILLDYLVLVAVFVLTIVLSRIKRDDTVFYNTCIIIVGILGISIISYVILEYGSVITFILNL